MKHTVKTIAFTFVAISALSTGSPMAAESDLQTGKSTTRQIVVQAADQKSEVKKLVAKLKQSQDALAGNEPVEEKLAGVIEPNQEKTFEKKVDEALFAPVAKAEPKKVEMPTVFSIAQEDLYNNLTNDQQVTLVAKLIKKYGYDTLYPVEVSNSYSNGSHYKTKTYGSNHGYKRNNYTSAYSTSNYKSAGGCKKN